MYILYMFICDRAAEGFWWSSCEGAEILSVDERGAGQASTDCYFTRNITTAKTSLHSSFFNVAFHSIHDSSHLALPLFGTFQS